MFSQNELKLQKDVLQKLEDLQYPDAQRISKEIIQHTQSDDELEEIILRLQDDEPWEYIKGWTEFFGFRLKVSPDTLIPRTETEELVQLALKLVKKGSTIIDIGTGSGAIILAIGKRIGNAGFKLIAIDKSIEALQVARENLKKAMLNVKTYETDLLNDVPVQEPYMLIANLPYIPTSEYNKLDKSVKAYEPKMALEGGKDGNREIYRLLDQLTNPLPYEILLELHPQSMENLLEYCKKFPEYTVHVIKDFRGLDRFLRLELTNLPQPE